MEGFPALVGRLRTVVWWRWAEPVNALKQPIDPKEIGTQWMGLL